MKRLLVSAAMGAALLGSAGVALAFSSNDYTLSGDTNYITPGNNASTRAVQIDSIVGSGAGYGGIDYSIGATPITLSSINNLSTDYRFSAGSCAGGSPRFEISVQAPTGAKNIFVYIGPPPNYINCPQYIWANTGNLVTPASFVDTAQLPGGNQYDTYAHALLLYGSYPVVGIQLVDDSGWALPGTGQIVDIDNTMINTTLYSYESLAPTGKEQCKGDAWLSHTRADGSAFKTQGDCIQYVNTGK